MVREGPTTAVLDGNSLHEPRVLPSHEMAIAKEIYGMGMVAAEFQPLRYCRVLHKYGSRPGMIGILAPMPATPYFLGQSCVDFIIILSNENFTFLTLLRALRKQINFREGPAFTEGMIESIGRKQNRSSTKSQEALEEARLESF